MPPNTYPIVLRCLKNRSWNSPINRLLLFRPDEVESCLHTSGSRYPISESNCRDDEFIDFSGLINTSTILDQGKLTMRPSVILNLNRNTVREATGRYRAANPRVFGSVLRGTDRDGSDLDLLVDALPGATLFDLGGLQDELELLLGVHVDLLTPGDLPIRFREKVLAEAQAV